MFEISKSEEEQINQLYNAKEGSYLIFSIHFHRYALKSSLIQEIMYGTKVHEIPFTPNYIEGVLNCRGNPYTVINVLKIEDANYADENEDVELNEKVFLLFKRDDDQFSIHISNIEVFFEPEEDDILEDKVKYKQKYIPLFNADFIEEIMCQDLGKDD